MDFSTAVKNFKTNPCKENLNQQVNLLINEMTTNEKIYMLSGHGLLITIKNILLHRRFYNYEGLPAGGCKRLGIPPIKFSDGPRGIVMGKSTCFPVPMCRASAFDPELEYRVGKAMADELIAQGANYYAGVCINLVRNPRWGRSQETYSEDPFVLGEYGSALTVSMQEEGVIACPKHFAMNSIEDLRFYVDVHADDRTLYEVYLPHFKKCIDAGALSIMGAYNRVDGTYCCENKRLLNDILRKEWGFDGFVISDFIWGVHEAEHSLRAGCDVEMMFTFHYRKIKKLLKKGGLTITQIDAAVGNILGVLIRVIPFRISRDKSVMVSNKHKKLALESAEKGMVLLKNNGVLPLNKDTKITVTGDYADVANIGDHGSSRVFSPNIITPYQGISNIFCNKTKVYNGTDVNQALKMSESSDVVLITAGSNYKLEGEFLINVGYKAKSKPKNSGGDRQSLRLSKEEIALIKALKEAGKKVIVSLYSGCAIITEDFKEYADAIIMNYYSGLEGGNAIANLISGDVNFSGKLPFTVAKNENDYPKFLSIGEAPYEIEYGYYHGYTLFDKENKEVEYPFGYGLSYTTFSIDGLKVENNQDSLEVSVNVTNTGKVSGADIVQVYVGSNCAEKERPIKLLKGFKRVELGAGERETVNIEILKEDMKFYNDDYNQWELDKSYTIYVGDDSKNAMKLKQSIYF